MTRHTTLIRTNDSDTVYQHAIATLGFMPTESLVIASLQPTPTTSDRVGLIARVDIEHAGAAARDLLRALRKDGATGVAEVPRVSRTAIRLGSWLEGGRRDASQVQQVQP